MAKYSLRKYEILSGSRQISDLFSAEHSIYCYPIKLFYLKNTSQAEHKSKVLFSVTVPKRAFPKAVDRNLLKRRIRESYRLNKYKLTQHINELDQLSVMFVYIGKKEDNFQIIDNAVKKILRELANKLLKG